jgi:hypothetical protein
VLVDPSVGIESIYGNKKLERYITDTKKELTKDRLMENYHVQYNNFKVNNNSDQANTGLYKLAVKKDQRLRLAQSNANSFHNPLIVRHTGSRAVGSSEIFPSIQVDPWKNRSQNRTGSPYEDSSGHIDEEVSTGSKQQFHEILEIDSRSESKRQDTKEPYSQTADNAQIKIDKIKTLRNKHNTAVVSQMKKMANDRSKIFVPCRPSPHPYNPYSESQSANKWTVRSVNTRNSGRSALQNPSQGSPKIISKNSRNPRANTKSPKNGQKNLTKNSDSKKNLDSLMLDRAPTVPLDSENRLDSKDEIRKGICEKVEALINDVNKVED